jgi:NosR/NirI family nitrous oxide reductase transcriptional regulator
VQCIHPDGHINPNECIWCLHCQDLYWDEHRCPAMIQKRLRREKLAASTPPSLPTGPRGEPLISKREAQKDRADAKRT